MAAPHVDSNPTKGPSGKWVFMTSNATVHYVECTQIFTESWLEDANMIILLVRDNQYSLH